MTVWCDDWQVAGRNLTFTVGDEITHYCSPFTGTALADLFGAGAAVEQPRWSLDLYEVALPAGQLVPRVAGHVRALRAVTCLRNSTPDGRMENVAGSGLKTPIGSTTARLSGRVQLGAAGRPTLVGFLLTLSHARFSEGVANPLLSG